MKQTSASIVVQTSTFKKVNLRATAEVSLILDSHD